ncbi:hypothetical protein SRM_00702 [Salinibacter ruber M8]|uniref:Uncharacterized protein n=1 Tax=Salinibacter ruber (strain M8) TaxID=761659 RepID=D5H6G8_SALRM|nr:hypothetical protein SRM_00702 [Salinibacter ruber M8]
MTPSRVATRPVGYVMFPMEVQQVGKVELCE